MNHGTRQADTLSAAGRLDWLRLIRSENVGPIVFHQLLNQFGTAGAALDALPDPPPLIYVLGDPARLAVPVVSIVGARNASAAAIRYTRRLARDLGGAGLGVASGLARGIDTAAHGGALESGTIAVLAGGVDVVYPAENQELYEAIVAQGAVISEMPPGTRPQARHFPRRNRLISGLALGVVVIEAAQRSGSLITARFALEQGREVFAVPVRPWNPAAGGPIG